MIKSINNKRLTILHLCFVFLIHSGCFGSRIEITPPAPSNHPSERDQERTKNEEEPSLKNELPSEEEVKSTLEQKFFDKEVQTDVEMSDKETQVEEHFSEVSERGTQVEGHFFEVSDRGTPVEEQLLGSLEKEESPASEKLPEKVKAEELKNKFKKKPKNKKNAGLSVLKCLGAAGMAYFALCPNRDENHSKAILPAQKFPLNNLEHRDERETGIVPFQDIPTCPMVPALDRSPQWIEDVSACPSFDSGLDFESLYAEVIGENGPITRICKLVPDQERSWTGQNFLWVSPSSLQPDQSDLTPDQTLLKADQSNSWLHQNYLCTEWMDGLQLSGSSQFGLLSRCSETAFLPKYCVGF